MKLLFLTFLGLFILGLSLPLFGFAKAEAIWQAISCVLVIMLLIIVWINTFMSDPKKPDIPS